MRKLALILALLASAVIVSYAQSREEIYDLSGYVYSPTFDLNVYENGRIIRKTFDVKSVYLEYVDDNFAGFTLMSDDNEKAEFSVVRWISKIFDYRFWVDNIQDYYVVVAKSGGRVAVEFMSAAYETSICCFFFNRRPTEEELEQKRKEEQERQRELEVRHQEDRYHRMRLERFMTLDREEGIEKEIRKRGIEYFCDESEYASFEQLLKKRVSDGKATAEKNFTEEVYEVYVYIDSLNVRFINSVDDDVVLALNSTKRDVPYRYMIYGRYYVKYGDGYVAKYKMKFNVPVQYGGEIGLERLKIKKTGTKLKYFYNNNSMRAIDKEADGDIPEIVRDKVNETVVKKGTYYLEYLVVYGEVVKFVVTDKKGNEYYSFK